MNFRLVILTHGDSATLEETLASFRKMVTPEPMDGELIYDGEGLPTVLLGYATGNRTTMGPLGFCGATKLAWEVGAGRGLAQPVDYEPPEFVFYLEHDFRFLRPVDLRPIATILDSHSKLAQMSLMRNAWGPKEEAEGSLYESRRDEYTKRYWAASTKAAEAGGVYPWLEHRSYLTTNPSLMRREFMAENPWPDYPRECEGRFGLDLVERGYSFGVWGNGEPWVEHFGERTGHSY